MHRHHGIPGGLDLVHQGPARRVEPETAVSPLVDPLVAVGHVAGAAAHAPEVPPLRAPLHAQVASLALGADVGEDGLLWRVPQARQLAEIWGIRETLVRLNEDLRVHLGLVRHVLPIGRRPQARRGILGIAGLVVGPAMLVAVASGGAKRPGRALDLARLGHHQAVELGRDELLVALTAGFSVDPR